VKLLCKKKVEAFFLICEGYLEFFALFQNVNMFVYLFHDAEPRSGSTALKCQSQGRNNEFTRCHRAAYWLLRRRPLIVSELVNWRRSFLSTSFVFSTRRVLNSRWRIAQEDGLDDNLRIWLILISNLGPETRIWWFRNFAQSLHVNMKFEVRFPDQILNNTIWSLGARGGAVG
jgi:hypothetical protein